MTPRTIIWPDESDPLGDVGIKALAGEIRRRLGPALDPAGDPLVSIIVVNRDGAGHLRRLLPGLVACTDYPAFELIVVDNGSSDDSLAFLRSVEAPFSISILTNQHNESFSDANNQGAELARGELLLFLNNDVEPFEAGWLRELIACLQTRHAGIAAATLVFPKGGTDWGYLVQHRAMQLRDDPVFLPADLHGHGDDPFGEGFGEDADATIPTGACMLVERELFQRIGGFTRGYFYGGEDIDLALKVRVEGRRVVCAGRAILIHRFSATRRKGGRLRAVGLRNRRLLWERWAPRLRREYELDRLAGGGSWAARGQEPRPDAPTREEVLALGFCLKSSEPAAAADDPLDALHVELSRRGHRCTILREDSIDDAVGFNYDVAVHLLGPRRYIPRPAQLSVLWAIGSLDELPAIERDRYDLAFAGDAGLLIDAALARAAELDFPTRISPAQP